MGRGIGMDAGAGGKDGDRMKCPLAMDLGLKAGGALYRQDCRLLWYRSHNFGSTERLRRGAHSTLNMLGGWSRSCMGS